MSGAVGPVNIAAAALTTQVGLVVIMFVGAVILRVGDVAPFNREESGSTWLAWVILPFGLGALAALVFSSDFAATWRPVYRGAQVPLLATPTAILVAFVADILCVAILVGSSGGSRNSPFQALYFVSPALAIFLREPFGRVTSYTGLVVILFLFQLSSVPRRETDSYLKAETLSYGVVSALCVLLTTLIGYITRPQ